MVTHRLQVERRTAKERWPETRRSTAEPRGPTERYRGTVTKSKSIANNRSKTDVILCENNLRLK